MHRIRNINVRNNDNDNNNNNKNNHRNNNDNDSSIYNIFNRRDVLLRNRQERVLVPYKI